MELNARNFQSGSNNIVRPETVSELAQRHMKDETHKTTEEELRNAVLELPGVAGIEAADDNVINADIKSGDYGTEEKEIVPNPLDVLS